MNMKKLESLLKTLYLNKDIINESIDTHSYEGQLDDINTELLHTLINDLCEITEESYGEPKRGKLKYFPLELDKNIERELRNILDTSLSLEPIVYFADGDAVSILPVQLNFNTTPFKYYYILYTIIHTVISSYMRLFDYDKYKNQFITPETTHQIKDDVIQYIDEKEQNGIFLKDNIYKEVLKLYK